MIRKYFSQYKFLLLLLPLLIACGSSGRQRHSKVGLPFKVHLFNVSADSLKLSRLGIVASVSNEKIQFLKQKNEYVAQFYLSLEISDENGNNVVLRDYSKNLTAPDFKATVKAFNNNYYLGYFDLKPGNYKLSVKLMDSYSKSEGIYRKELTLADYQKPEISNSHILFTTRQKIDFDSLKSVTFDFSGDIPDSLFAYVQFIAKEPGKVIKITYELQDTYEKILDTRTAQFKLPLPRTQIFLPINRDKLVGGRNQLIIKYEYSGQKSTTKTSIYVSWGKLKHTQTVSKLSMKQLKLVANGKDIKQIEKAEAAERDSLLMAYWKERDPTPETPVNELYEEFKRRLNEANRMFGVSRREGWNTDRGYIYVKYGPPEQVEKDIPGRDGFGRYEIWVYQILRRRFIFYDRMGTGEYRLISQ